MNRQPGIAGFGASTNRWARRSVRAFSSRSTSSVARRQISPRRFQVAWSAKRGVRGRVDLHARRVQLHSLDEAVVLRERDVERGARRDEVVGRLGFPEHPPHFAQHRENWSYPRRASASSRSPNREESRMPIRAKNEARSSRSAGASEVRARELLPDEPRRLVLGRREQRLEVFVLPERRLVNLVEVAVRATGSTAPAGTCRSPVGGPIRPASPRRAPPDRRSPRRRSAAGTGARPSPEHGEPRLRLHRRDRRVELAVRLVAELFWAPKARSTRLLGGASATPSSR